MKILIVFLFLPISLFAQKLQTETMDSLKVDFVSYPTYSVKIGNSSSSDPARVFVSTTRDFDSIKCLIVKCYFSRKQDYNEYYLLGVPESTNTETFNQVLSIYLTKIDSARTIRNRSTFLRDYVLDNLSDKITYLNSFKKISEVSNMFWFGSVNEMRKTMGCANRYIRCP